MKQLYKRWLWLFVFNAHCHNDNSFSSYTFLDHISRKSSVASFLFNYISEKVDKNPNIRETVLLSDAVGGQNKNATMLRFCSWLSKTLRVPITDLYPCDHNFATCRDKPEPFALVHDESLLLDWDQALTPYFENTPKQKGNTFRIQ
ncbi:hypothetical protein PR048_019560 [Dryococelus australis]|uniref:Uncharacterized protein n=1 Tax=Dryococelus australis TaxID=614101 RepID=A0ABQ9H3S8_9NEOP|nr:hypothetical protein PR048_019560 [Dryococelus australis]